MKPLEIKLALLSISSNDEKYKERKKKKLYATSLRGIDYDK